MAFLKDLGDLILRPEILTLLTGIIVAGVTWLLNERGKRKHNDYIRKEERYAALLDNLEGFYIDSQSRQQKDEFIRELNRCWLYCPDTVINKGYAFLITVHTDKKCPDEDKEKAVGEFILEIRKDLLTKKFGLVKRTKLEADDFRHFKGT